MILSELKKSYSALDVQELLSYLAGEQFNTTRGVRVRTADCTYVTEHLFRIGRVTIVLTVDDEGNFTTGLAKVHGSCSLCTPWPKNWEKPND